MIWPWLPQPWEGRCWNSPTESRSPYSMLMSLDSCSAAASAIVTARVGSSRAVATALIVAALAACSVLSVYGELLMSQLADCGIGSLSVIHERTANAAAVDQDADGDQDDDGRGGLPGFRPCPLDVRVQLGVETGPGPAGAAAVDDLERAGQRRCAGTAGRPAPDSSRALTTRPSGRASFTPAVTYVAGLDDAVVAERDADAGVGAEQAARADRDRPRCRRRTACP